MEQKRIGELVWYCVALLVIAAIAVIVYCNMNPKDPDKWCEVNMPDINTTKHPRSDPRVNYCYNEGWAKYCQIRAPEYCPQG